MDSRYKSATHVGVHLLAMDKSFKMESLLLMSCIILIVAASNDPISFPDDSKMAEDQKRVTPGMRTTKPRFGFDTGDASSSVNLGVQPNKGGISGSATFSSSYGGQGHSGSQSQSFNFQVGDNTFSTSQSGSQASSFNSGMASASQASSHASSFSGGNGDHSGSSASSQAASFGIQGSGFNYGGSSSSSNSQSFSGQHGGAYGGSGFPNEFLSPEFIRRHHLSNRTNSTRQRPKKPSNWFTQTLLLGRKHSGVFRRSNFSAP